MDIANLRKEYTAGGLRRADLNAAPIPQFTRWFEQALLAQVMEPNAMTLATVDHASQPSSRIVLLKGVSDEGFSFFTNYESRKGRELEANPRAAFTFFWPGLERQVCGRGRCQKLSREESEIYFRSRPIGSRLSTWVSRQTEVVESREILERRLAEVTAEYGGDAPIPPYWGGFMIIPETVEFWQGRPNRLHDRFRYTRRGAGWKIDRLSP